ncbi:uncharacterized protein C12orf60 homolog [Elephas maximus indicus]|uniref:uncharacterized protein C12orf60 homolog n=1 Tax=Elephas maximus indicus TaxID=99487 RepID=UPI0021168CB2|nr:uncharacterized protein C12orf60 homolog [Elephas maximus indicus]XP_049738497.1 uncharacterized protein C12orf60 homolog [Elephas maximus indicus]XP_049738498.1 uncharacterized protein C12orf60 homolog [Elephas maximus indicus]
MSSKPQEDRERLAQAAKMFFFHIQDISSFTNTLIELFNRNMNTQILLTAVKEDVNIKDFFEQMLKIVTEMQSVVDTMNKNMQDEPLHSKIATAVSSVVEQSTNVKELHQAAKTVFKNAHIPLIVSVLSRGNVLGILISSITLLMKFPIMNLRLSDFYRKDTKEQSDTTTSGESMSSGPPETNTTDMLKKLQEALKDENAKNPIESAANQLEEIVKTTGPVLEILQKATKSMETNFPLFKKVSDK